MTRTPSDHLPTPVTPVNTSPTNMSPTSSALDHQSELIGRFLDGTLDLSGTEELLQLVRQNQQVRTMLLRSYQTHLLLLEKCEEEKAIQQAAPLDGVTDDEIERAIASGRFDDLDRYVEKRPFALATANIPVPVVRSHSLFRSSLALFVPRKNESWSESTAPLVWAMCLLLFVVVLTSVLFSRIPTPKPDSNLPVVARIVSCYDTVWARDADVYQPGAEVGGNDICLESGQVHLLLRSGAEIILEGPCRFTATDPLHGLCSAGRLSARLPKGIKGLEIATPFGSVIDQSTAFSLDLNEQQLDVEVIEGKVDVRDDTGQLWHLAQGMARRLTALRPPQPLPFEKKIYIDPVVYQKKIEQRDQNQYRQKLEVAHELNQSPGLLARFDFTSGQPPANEAVYGQQKVSSLSINECTWTGGELFGTKALRFAGPDDYASVAVQGKYRSMTLSARVRIDRLDNQSNVLFASDDFLFRTGSFCWQINGDGHVQFQLTPPSRTGKVCYDTMPIVSKKVLGTWIQLTVTLDADKKTIRQYYNGRPIGSSPWKEPFELEPGSCTLGNVKPGTKSFGSRNLDGALSEFTLREDIVAE